jgi:hypothetical protein
VKPVSHDSRSQIHDFDRSGAAAGQETVAAVR